MTDNMQWERSDGWMLMSLFLAGGEKGVRLQDIIGVADGINHAIPTRDELSQALTKFLQCELIAVQEDRYILSTASLPAIKKASEGRGGLFESIDKGLRYLETAGLVKVSDKRIELSDEQVETAYNAYHEKFWSTYAKMHEKQ